MNTVEVKFLRDRVISSTKGHTVRFKAGEPKHIPVVILEECLQAGAIPTDEETALAVPAPEPVKVDPQGPDRRGAITTKMREMAARNQRDDFTAAGRPDVRVLERELGFKLDARERDELWADLELELKGGA